jgi:predicted nucleotidyltransferase
MVRILNYHQLHAIPSPSLLEKALDEEVSSCINRLIERGLITGAVSYGSVARGDHSETSDIDVLAKYCSFEALQLLRLSRSQVRSTLNVIVEYSVFHNRLAETPFHRSAFSYVNHIRANQSEKRVFGVNPLEGFLTENNPRNDHRLEYAREMGSIVDALAKRYLEAFDNETRYYHFLKGLLEKPAHFVREAVQLIHNGLPQQNGRTIDDNQSIRELFVEYFGASDITENMTAAADEVMSYKHYIRDIRLGRIRPSQQEYVAQLANIENIFARELAFMVETCLRLNEFLTE